MQTLGIDHLGLSVKDLSKSLDFFVNTLGWKETGHDASYPRSAVSDGTCRLTLWQVDTNAEITPFNRRTNIGLHHVALKVDTEQSLNAIHNKVEALGLDIEFSPEYLGKGPRKHFICYEPGGLRVEFIWNG